MKSKTKFLPLIAFAAVLVSLVFIIPVFSATGAVRFVDSADTTKDQAYGRQGGNVILEVADTDLNVAVKRVLLPVDYTENAATAAVVDGSATITLSTTTATALATATTTASRLAPGDTIAIGSDTVRTITSVTLATKKVVVNKAFTATNGTAKVNKVTQALGLFAVCPTCALAEKVTIAAGAANNTTIATFFGLAAVPIADSGSAGTPMNLANRFTSNADTVTNTSDLFLADSSGNAIVAASTTVTFVSGADAKVDVVNDVAGMIVYAVYWGGAKNDTGTLVKATSNSDPTGITVALTETGPTTGIFRLTILATSSASDVNATTPQLQVGANDSIVLKYTDASPAGTISKSLTVETTNPIFSNLLPANGTAGQASRPVIEADITDGDSGVNNKLVRVIFAVAADGATIDASPAPQDVDVKGTGISLDAITSGFRAKQRLPQGMAPSTDATIFWWVKSTDTAGNIGISDRQTTISSVADTCDATAFSTAYTGGSVSALAGKAPATTADVKGCQPFSVKVDFGKPTVSAAKTGTWWNADLTTTNKTVTDVTKAKDTSIMVTFNENLDGTSVQTADFEVDGVAPLSAEWFSGAKANVFLTVASMAADARPKVELVGNVQDVAGNAQTTGKVANAADGIAPTLTVTLTGTGSGSIRPVTKDKLTINITANEDVGQPVVTVRKVNNETLTYQSQLGATTTPIAVLTAARTYKAESTITTAGLYSVYVTAADATAQNTGTKGLNGSAALSIKSDSKGLLFEVDTAIAAPTIGPATTDDADPFITIAFTAEGTEYSSASSAAADFDSADTVTITSASLNGVDITPLATSDNKSFLHKATGLAVGDHKVKVKAKDLAGKEKEFTGTVKVTARSDFKLPLNPGWNLVSIPGEPSDAAIDNVIPADHPVSTVLTYDPASPGGWLTAVRGGDGKFAGTLTTISSTRAYWVLTNSFEPIKVAIPRLASGAAVLPPTVPIVIGWNFVPVLDVTGDKKAGSSATTTVYAAGVSVSRVWTFDTVNNKWVDVTSTTMAVGSGYWVYATKAGTLIP